ncbi:sulfatase-like hydrolase/transferase [Asaia sp. HN010]|uniref:LTA synthase family protein n=1 Tax=Asaia sp. HN010 TaxID=3081233 RepID=UPI00301B2881
MILLLNTFLAVLVIASSLDHMAQPNKYPTHRSTPLRERAMGLPFRVLPLLLIFGGALAVTGRSVGAGVLSIVATVLLVLGSNLKRALLDEPLLFSDAVLVKACFQHPRFYVDALPLPARVAVLSGLSATVLTIVALFVFDLTHLTRIGGSALVLRIIGLLLGVSSLLLLRELARTSLPRRLMPLPDYDATMPMHGFLATTSISWLLWLQDRHRPISSHSQAARREPPVGKAPIVVVIQCESFADPTTLMPTKAAPPPLPKLEQLRHTARHHGRLHMSGFGAYTMRTEYGVLFGHEETELGFRRFDPYLSAQSHFQDALPNRLKSLFQNRIFVHPHDMRFYARDKLMPASGFTKLVGAPEFDDSAKCGPHVSDRSLGEHLVGLINDAVRKDQSTFIFAVTIENHGPWPEGLSAYLDHLAHGDALLGAIHDALDECGHPALLAFYGDHRPTIPNAVTPGNGRHTPFLIFEFGTQTLAPRSEQDLTPAELHHAIYEAILRTQ